MVLLIYVILFVVWIFLFILNIILEKKKNQREEKCSIFTIFMSIFDVYLLAMIGHSIATGNWILTLIPVSFLLHQLMVFMVVEKKYTSLKQLTFIKVLGLIFFITWLLATGYAILFWL